MWILTQQRLLLRVRGASSQVDAKARVKEAVRSQRARNVRELATLPVPEPAPDLYRERVLVPVRGSVKVRVARPMPPATVWESAPAPARENARAPSKVAAPVVAKAAALDLAVRTSRENARGPVRDPATSRLMLLHAKVELSMSRRAPIANLLASRMLHSMWFAASPM